MTNDDKLTTNQEKNYILDIANSCLNCKIPNCIVHCPINMPIPKILTHIKNHEEELAAKIIYQYSTLPFVCGNLCDVERKCSKACIKALKFKGVPFNEVESYLGIKYVDELFKDLPNEKSYRVAIIGGGVCAITIAIKLLQKGIRADIYEKTDKIGGVITHSMPDFRYDKTTFNYIIKKMIKYGVKVHYQQTFGDNLSINNLKDYQAVVFAIGSDVPRKVLSEEDTLQAIKLLENKDKLNTISSKKVLVLGGGNVAIDISRSLLRLKNRVFLVYRRNIDACPASKKELQLAINEGLIIKECLTPSKIIKKDNKITGLICKKTTLYEDGSKRLNFKITDEEEIINGDIIIQAIGSTNNYQYLQNVLPKLFDNLNNLIINDDLTTPYPNFYIGGDALTGPKDFVNAMFTGQKIANLIINKISDK